MYIGVLGWLTASAAAANTLWTPFFVQGWIPLSFVVMIWLLVSLAAVFVTIRNINQDLTMTTRWFTEVPFSGYFAWITVAVPSLMAPFCCSN